MISCGAIDKNEHDSNKKKVFLFAGQSNMDGRGNGDELSKNDLDRLAKVADRVQFFYNHRPVTPLQLTTLGEFVQNKFSFTKCFGPELFFGIELAENDDNVFMIPQSQDKNSADYYEQNPPPIYHYTTKSMKKIGVQFFNVF